MVELCNHQTFFEWQLQATLWLGARDTKSHGGTEYSRKQINKPGCRVSWKRDKEAGVSVGKQCMPRGKPSLWRVIQPSLGMRWQERMGVVGK